MKQKVLCVLIIAAFAFTGCSSMSKRTKCACVGAAAGAAVGATAGAVIGHQGHTSNKVGGGIIGGVAGALIGGTTGFLLCKEEVKPVEAAPLKPVVKPLAKVEKPPVVIEKIVLNSIRFDFDKAVIKPEFYPVLDEGVSMLKQHPDKKVSIEGHTDWIGTEKYNMGLSLRRANSVKAYLIRKGISENQLSVTGFGKENPVADNRTNDGRRMNRRVEFIINN